MFLMCKLAKRNKITFDINPIFWPETDGGYHDIFWEPSEISVKIGGKMPGVHDFQKFLVNDAQLKAFGNCVNQVNLFALDPEGHKNPPANPHQRPNRVALVVVSDSDSF